MAKVFVNRVTAKRRGNYIRQLSLEVVWGSLRDSGGTAQIFRTELLPPRVQLWQKVRGKSGALRRNVCSVGGGAAAIFNTRASKPPKLSVVGLVLVLEQTFVSSLRRPHYTHIRKITDQQLGRGGGGGVTGSTFDRLIPIFNQCTDLTPLPHRYILINQASSLLMHFLTSTGKTNKKQVVFDQSQSTLLLHWLCKTVLFNQNHARPPLLILDPLSKDQEQHLMTSG